MEKKEKLGIDLVDITAAIIAQAPQGMGSQERIITGYLYRSYYCKGAVSRIYRSTISRILRKKCNFAPELFDQYREYVEDLRKDIKMTLSLYPGIARRCIVRDQIADLVKGSSIEAADKQLLQQGYLSHSVEVDDISNYIVDVAHYVICHA